MKKLAWIGTVAFSLCVSFIIACYLLWPKAEGPDAPGVLPEKKADPIQRFVPADWFIGSSKIEVLEAIYLPFLHKRFVKKGVRVAQIEGTGIVFHSPKATYMNSRLTKGTVITLASTGQLLRIELSGGIPTGPLHGQMTLAKAEDYYRSVSSKYVDLPANVSPLTFQEVLNSIYKHGFAEIEKAARIEAVFIMAAADVAEATPTVNWIVHFYGIPPYPARGASKSSNEARSYLRYTLDEHGDVLSADSLP